MFKQTYFKSHCLYNVSWFPKVVLSGSGSEIVGWSLVAYGVWSRIKSLKLCQWCVWCKMVYWLLDGVSWCTRHEVSWCTNA